MKSLLPLLATALFVTAPAPADDADIRQRIVGVGLRVRNHDDGLLVIGAIEGSPAAAAGVPVGSIILTIDGEPTIGIDVKEGVKRLGGDAHTTVRIKVRTPEGAARSFTLTRAEFILPGKFSRGSRFDYILATPALAERCPTARVVNDLTHDYWSDHYPVMADFTPKDGKDPIRVITYNILEGFANRPQSKAEVGAWLKAQQPALVAFQELNSITRKELREWAGIWGHTHVAVLRRGKKAAGITSRAPLKDVELFTEGFFTGVLCCKTQGIVFYNVHLRPGLQAHVGRLREAQRLLKIIGKIDESSPDMVILGDFNAVSPLDREAYRRMGMGDRLESEPPMEAFRDAGWIDVAYEHRGPDDPFITIPTPLGKQKTP